MLLEPPAPDPTSGDPGCEFHKIPAPEPVGLDGLAGKLSHQQVTALQALSAGQSVREAAKSSGVGRKRCSRQFTFDRRPGLPHVRRPGGGNPTASRDGWRQ